MTNENRDLRHLIMGARNELDLLISAQELIELCVEHLDDGESTINRLGLLLEAYTSRSTYHLQELKVYLDGVGEHLWGVQEPGKGV